MRLVLLSLLLLISSPVFSQLFNSSVEGGTSTIRSYRLLTNTNNSKVTSDIIVLRNTFEEPIMSYGIFAGYTKSVKKRVFVGGELKYQRLGYATNLLQRTTFGGNTPLPSLSLDFIDIYHIVSLNISTGYVFIKKEKTNIYVNGGTGLDFMAKNYIKTRTSATSNSNTPDALYNGRRLNMSAQFGVGIMRQITENSALRFDLEYSRNLFNFNTDPIGLQLVYASFNIGYIFSLNTQ